MTECEKCSHYGKMEKACLFPGVVQKCAGGCLDFDLEPDPDRETGDDFLHDCTSCAHRVDDGADWHHCMSSPCFKDGVCVNWHSDKTNL